MKILVADDDSTLRTELAALLEAEGHEVSVAADGTEALQRIAEGPLDVVLIDWHMPGPSGPELVRRVRDRAPRASVIVMTGYGSVEAAIGALKAGASEFLQKPFELAALEHALKGVRREFAEAAKRATAPRSPGERTPEGGSIVAAFLTHHTGILLADRIHPGEESIDQDILTGTLDAIQNFMRISFPVLKGRDLRTIAQGEYTLLIERGQFVYLSLVVRGDDSEALRARMREQIRAFEDRNRDRLSGWRGDMSEPVGLAEALAPFVPV